LLLRGNREFAVHFVKQFQQANALDAHSQRLVGDIGKTHFFVDEPCSFVQGTIF
jgi:hypothetical protein